MAANKIYISSFKKKIILSFGTDHLNFMRVRGAQEDVFHVRIFFHPRHDPVFLFAYNTEHTSEFSLPWIFVLEKLGPDFFFPPSP